MTHSQNKLFRCSVKVRFLKGAEQPPNMVGAYVDCFVAAPEHLGALRLAVDKLKSKGCAFEELVDGMVHQLEPLQWDEFVAETWPECRDHFPAQGDVIRIVQAGGLFLGPFCGWESEA